MNIYRNIYYDGKYRGLFELRNAEGKFMWCPSKASNSPKTYPYPQVLYKNHADCNAAAQILSKNVILNRDNRDKIGAVIVTPVKTKVLLN